MGEVCCSAMMNILFLVLRLPAAVALDVVVFKLQVCVLEPLAASPNAQCVGWMIRPSSSAALCCSMLPWKHLDAHAATALWLCIGLPMSLSTREYDAGSIIPTINLHRSSGKETPMPINYLPNWLASRCQGVQDAILFTVAYIYLFTDLTFMPQKSSALQGYVW